MSVRPGDPVQIKFCGFTRPADAELAISLGIDALGFNFYPLSKRALPWPDACEWIGRLPPGPLRVAVVVNPSPAQLREIEASRIFDLLQFHGDESPDFCNSCALPWIKALPCPLPPNFPFALSAFETNNWLLDAVAPAGQYGGTGSVADWAHASRFTAERSNEMVWLAGGLAENNVATAIRSVRPGGVDVAGGIESHAGIKCPEKMRNFVDAVRSMPSVPQ